MGCGLGWVGLEWFWRRWDEGFFFFFFLVKGNMGFRVLGTKNNFKRPLYPYI